MLQPNVLSLYLLKRGRLEDARAAPAKPQESSFPDYEVIATAREGHLPDSGNQISLESRTELPDKSTRASFFSAFSFGPSQEPLDPLQCRKGPNQRVISHDPN